MSRDRPRCPECDGRLKTEAEETVCGDCGLVVDAERIDHGPEWRSFAEEETDPRRAAPADRNHPDRGLGSEVGFESRYDGRLDKWNKRTKAGSHKARNRGYATQEIHRMGHALELPASVTKRGKWLFRQAHDAEETDGRDLDAVANEWIRDNLDQVEAMEASSEFLIVSNGSSRVSSLSG